MKKHYLSVLFFIYIFSCGNHLSAQMIGSDIFLQGHWLEIGQQNNGDFGTTTHPATYHAHCASCILTNALAEVYDYGHDGWTVGAPTYMGDYTFPGSPFEGWELQVNGARTQAFCNGGAAGYTGGLGMTGSNVSYSNVGGSAKANWVGSATSGGATLSIKQETRVDTQASWVIVTTKFYNTSATTTVNGVYYMRSSDPDNDETWPGGSFTTTNIIDYQQASDPDRRVQVRAYGGSTTHPPLALCTKDCRAVALIYNAWPLTSGQDLAALWNQTYSGGFYTLHGTDPGDIAIALVYNLGNIAPLDSTFISYAYTFDGINGIDSAFPEPILGVNGIPGIPSGAPPAPTYDTFNTCLFPGMTTLPINISSATTGVWTWSKWTWSPGTGLSATTGTSVSINTTVLPPSITYTITGTSTAACGTRVMYLTVLTCNGAIVNSPCLGDPLIFNAPGDSTGATYVWLGPNSWTTTVATTQTFSVNPSTWADTGTYHVIKTVAGTHDTASTVVILHPKPTVTASSNSPLCTGVANTLTLFSNTDISVTSYGWSGPAGFVSGIQNPTIPGFTAPDTGTYTVIVSTTYGCKDTATTHVVLLPPPGAPIVTDPNPYCQGDPFIPFTIISATGATVYWYPSGAGGVGSTTTPTVNTAVAGTYKYYFGQTIGLCESPIDSITIVVNPTPAIPVATNNSPICADSLLKLFATDATTGVSYRWTGPSSFASTLQNPTIANAQASNNGVYNVVVTIGATGCHSSSTTTVNIKPTPPPPTINANTPCDSFFAMNLQANDVAGCTYTWSGPSGYTSTEQNPIISPAIYGVNDGVYTVTATLNGCPSLPVTKVVKMRLNPKPPVTRDSIYCQYSQTAPLTYQVDSALGSHLTWYSSPTGGLLTIMPSVDNALVTYPDAQKWWVTQTVDGCESHPSLVADTIVYQPNFKIVTNRNWVCDHDTLSFSYSNMTPLISGTLSWSLPPGASLISGSLTSPSIIVKFDSVYGPHVVSLTVGELNNMCVSYRDTSVKVVALPTTHCYMNPNICLGDTVGLAVSDESNGASIFSWRIDGVPMFNSTALNMIASSSNSGGPFKVSWNDSGVHFITISCTTDEGCKSDPTYDTVKVHGLPDATFTYTTKAGTLCVEDSVLFIANNTDHNCSYWWEPEHSFNNNNKSEIWGKVEFVKSNIMLTVTDPFGCKGLWTQEIDPDACCKVLFPNAFSPNGDVHNKRFGPIYEGYHRFHSFRIVNRWGQTVFESANSDPSWDGTFNGVPQDMGVYYYFIKYDCGGKVIEEKGDCTLVR